jgi:exonuclease SbcC
MRILRIAIHNLNSLKGEHVLDFTSSPLADHPLYAIVGPTGSGKTTILDAITLALYGQTERTKTIVDAKSEVATVMTHGTARCRAEVEYETSSGRYRNVWRRRRAHGKVGKALQHSEREIGKWNEREQDYTILATKKSEVGPLTEEITGLTYDRFVRSVMLTQGDFDRFLKSKTEEKAEILEQITGTDIYRELSVAAFDRHKLAREAYSAATDRLEHSLPLPEEERSQLDSEVLEATVNTQLLRTQSALFTGQLATHDTVIKQRAEYDRATVQQRQIDTEWEQLAPQRKQLARSEELSRLSDDLATQQRLGKEVTATLTDLATTRNSAEQTRATLARNQELTLAARRELTHFREQEPQREQKLCQAEVLEQEVRLLEQGVAQGQSQLALHLRSRKKIEAAVADNEGAVQELNRRLAGRSPEQIATTTERLEAQLPELETRVADLNNAIAYRKLCDKINLQTEENGKLAQQLKEVVTKKEQVEGDIKWVGQEVDNYLLKQQNAKLKASLEAHRNDLKDGAPCPLCGALHHPYAEEGLPKYEASQLERQLNEAQIRLTALDGEAVKYSRQERDLERQQATITARLTEFREQLANLSSPIEGELAQLSEQQKKLVEQLAGAREELRKLRLLRPLLPELKGKEVELAQQKQQLDGVINQITAAEQQLREEQNRLEQRRHDLKELIGDKSVTECRKADAQTGKELQQKVDRRSQEEQRQANEMAAIQSQLKVLSERYDKMSVDRQQIEKRLLKELTPLGIDITEATQQLLPPERVDQLRQQLQQVEREQVKITALLARIMAEVEASEQELSGLPDREAVQQSLTYTQQQLSAAEQEIGALRQRQAEDDKRREQTDRLREELSLLEKDRDRWARMNELIGSASGKKFQSFAQGITLQRLVATGNRHLETINPRYHMVYAPPAPGDKETLELEIIDTYMNDNRRTMATLSGGESFLISLALALGLSDLASGKQLIQSLFIDEGFGTLDSKTLDQAMITLEQLQARGKTIGIISHVQQLRERIVCQVQLEPLGDGFSRIEVVD